MKIQGIRNIDFEGYGLIADWVKERGHILDDLLLTSHARIPEYDSFDALIVMGGPMSAFDDGDRPWLPGERALLKASVESGKIVLGICLGAQLMAGALGATVTKNHHKEIGWFPIREIEGNALSPSALRLCQSISTALSTGTPVFHWHGDTFGIPSDAERLFESEACANQAFAFGPKAIGLQFHIEMMESSLHTLIDACGEEIDAGGAFVQSRDALTRGARMHVRDNRKALFRLLDTLFAQEL
jgi:GMP synthase-like glutamine amidotransferase